MSFRRGAVPSVAWGLEKGQSFCKECNVKQSATLGADVKGSCKNKGRIGIRLRSPASGYVVPGIEMGTLKG